MDYLGADVCDSSIKHMNAELIAGHAIPEEVEQCVVGFIANIRGSAPHPSQNEAPNARINTPEMAARI